MDICFGLLVFGIVLFVLAAVGHGVWIVGAAGLRSLSGPSSASFDERDRNRTVCPRCQMSMAKHLLRCPSCGLYVAGPVARELLDLEASARVLQTLASREALDRAVVDRFYQAIEARQHELIARSAEPPPLPGSERRPAPGAEARDITEQIAARFARVRATQSSITLPTVTPPPEPPAQIAAVNRRPGWTPPTATPPPEPPVPRRTWGQVLAEFMEDRNILWGELVGGLLIVGCSIALVISLWRTLEAQVPYFPFLVMAALTGALFAAGRYTLGRWKLASTSRGLLAIATLLTPLDFLVLAGLTRGRPSGPLEWATELAAVAGFAALVRWSATVLLPAKAPRLSWLVALAVVGASGSVLLVPRWLDAAQPTPWLFAVLSLTPVLLQLAAVGPPLLELGRRERIAAPDANVLLVVLGLTAFAAAAAMVFIALWCDSPMRGIRLLALPVAVAGLPLLTAGAIIRQKLDWDSPEPQVGLSPTLSLRVGTIVGVLGLTLMLTALGLGWPRPAALVAVGFLNGFALSGLARVVRLPLAHAPGALCFALGFLTLFHWLTGNVAADGAGTALLTLATSPHGAIGLLLLAALFAGLGEWLARSGRSLDALYQHAAAGVVALAALVSVLPAGEVDGRGILVYGGVGLGALLVNARWRVPPLTEIASLVLTGSAVYVTRRIAPDLPPVRVAMTALLAHAGLLAAASRPAFRRPWTTAAFAVPMLDTALVVSGVSLVPLALAIQPEALRPCAGHCLGLATLWLLIAWGRGWPWLLAGGQAMVMASVLFAIADGLLGQEWVAGRPAGLLHAWSLQVFGLGLAGTCLLWAALRLGTRNVARAQALLEPGWLPVDRLLLWLLCAAHAGLAWAVAGPEAARELVTPGIVLTLRLGLAWSLAGLLTASLLLTPRERPRHDAGLALLLIALTVPVLIALGFGPERATASALRWGLALAYLAGSATVDSWIDARQTRPARGLLLGLAAVPVLALSVWAALRVFAGAAIPGPDVGSWFTRLDPTASLVLPLIIVAFAMTWQGARIGSAGYLFAAGQVVTMTVVGGTALGFAQRLGMVGPRELVILVQRGSLTAAVWALAWLTARRWRHPVLLPVQVALGLSAGTVLLAIAALQVMTGPWPGVLPDVGGWLGAASWLAAVLAAAWLAMLTPRSAMLHVAALAGLGGGVWLASASALFSAWTAYHVLTLAWTTVALFLVIASWVGTATTTLGPGTWDAERRGHAADVWRSWFPSNSTRRWVELLGMATVALALGGTWDDPGRPYWSSAATLAVAVLFGSVAVWVRRPGYVVTTGLLLNLVAYLVWQAGLVDAWGLHDWYATGPGVTDRFLLLQTLALATGSTLWSLVELGLRRREPAIDLRGWTIPYAHAAALIAVQLLATLVLTGLASDLLRLGVHLDDALVWPTIAAVAVSLFVCFWDPEASAWALPAAPLFVVALTGLGLLLHLQQLSPPDLRWWGMLALAGFVLIATVAVRWIPRGVGRRFGVAPVAESRLAHWFLPALALLAATGVGLSLWVSTATDPVSARLAGPMAVLLLLTAAATLAGLRTDRPELLTLSLLLGVVAAVEASWSSLDLGSPVPWLHRSTRVLVIGAASAALFSWPTAANRWAASARQLAPSLARWAAAWLVCWLVHEFLVYNPDQRRTGLAWFDVGLASAALVATLVGAVAVAVARGTPYGVTPRGRTQCVWAAELLLLLLLIHLRLSVPDLFPSFLGRYWPFTILAWSFLGVGLGELFRRRGLPVLADPLHRTGLFLPTLPLAAYIVRPLANFGGLAQVVPGLQPIVRYLDRMPTHPGQHASVWFLVGVLLALVALVRRASGWALLAALVANCGLWVLYANTDGLGWAAHPQLWLAPVGMILLTAELLNRGRLGPNRSTAARYGGLLVIYISSTADMFIAGLGHSVLLPIVLAALSVAGVLAGVALRVRGFLYVGAAFLALVVFAQIWHAAVDRGHTWVWWVSGIALGVAVLSLFALFEKRRDDVLRALEGIRQWQ